MRRITKAAAVMALCLMPVSVGLAYQQKAIYEKPDGSNVGARVTFSYKDDSMFQVRTCPGFVTDIQLREGEELTYVAGGDTKSWLIDKAKVGSIQHVYIKPLEPEKHTNIIVNTDTHTYRFDVWSAMGEYDPLITFTFPEDRKNKVRPASVMPSVHGAVNRDYEIKAKNKDKFGELIPKEIMDDGERTYIKVPETNKYDMPVLYMVNPWDKKQTLINYRIRNGYYVADVVMEHGRLLYHQKYGIDFYNRKKAGASTEAGKKFRERIAEIQQETWMDDEFIESAEDVAEPAGNRVQAPPPPLVRVPEANPVEDEVYQAPPSGYDREVAVRPAPVQAEDMFIPVKEKPASAKGKNVSTFRARAAAGKTAPRAAGPVAENPGPSGELANLVGPPLVRNNAEVSGNMAAADNVYRGPLLLQFDNGQWGQVTQEQYMGLAPELRAKIEQAGRVRIPSGNR